MNVWNWLKWSVWFPRNLRRNFCKNKKIEVVLVGVKDHIFKQFEELKVIPKTLPEEKAYNSVRSGLKYLKYQLENPS